MARSALQLRLEKQAEDEERWQHSLKSGTIAAEQKNKVRIWTPAELSIIVEGFGRDATPAGIEPIRSMSTFNRAFKTNDNGKIITAVAQHLYGKYPAPNFLTSQWARVAPSQGPELGAEDRWGVRRRQAINNNQPAALPHDVARMMVTWWIVAASGGSLWKEHTRTCYTPHGPAPGFTKRENHVFLNCNLGLNALEAMIYAIGTSYSDNKKRICRVAKSKLSTIAGAQPLDFYTSRLRREIIRFFCEHDFQLTEINDHLDYLQYAGAQNRDYTLQGRTPETIRRAAQDWHYELARVKRMGNASWTGVPIPNSEFQLPNDEHVTWFIEQINTSKGLAAEGTAMHHCVYGYQQRCIDGSCAIWSLKRKIEKRGFSSETTRQLTIEMNTAQGDLVQIRGFANRIATREEIAAVRFWAQKNDLRVKGG